MEKIAAGSLYRQSHDNTPGSWLVHNAATMQKVSTLSLNSLSLHAKHLASHSLRFCCRLKHEAYMCAAGSARLWHKASVCNLALSIVQTSPLLLAQFNADRTYLYLL